LLKQIKKNDTIWDEIKKCRIDEGTQVRIIKRTPALKWLSDAIITIDLCTKIEKKLHLITERLINTPQKRCHLKINNTSYLNKIKSLENTGINCIALFEIVSGL